MNYFEVYDKAERIFNDIQDKPYSEQMEIIDCNLTQSDSDSFQYMWEVVRCKAKAVNLSNKSRKGGLT